MPISSEFQDEFTKKYKEALIKKFYYGDRLEKVSNYNKWLETGLAVFAGGTFLGFFSDLAISSSILSVLTVIFSFIAAVLSIIKKYWNTNEDVKFYNGLYSHFSLIEQKYLELRDIVRATKNVGEKGVREKFVEITILRPNVEEDINVELKIAKSKIVDRIDEKSLKEKCDLRYIPTETRISEKQFESVLLEPAG